ncbi:LysM domain protein [Apiospora sp. TS-2023a]
MAVVCISNVYIAAVCRILFGTEAEPGHEDTCIGIAIDSGISTLDLVIFNTQLERNCSNLHAADPWWGSTLCVSPPGGTYSGTPSSDVPINGAKGGSKGHATQSVAPPPDAAVATNTTLACGAWYVHGELQCAQICLSNYLSIREFTAANPSLGTTTCDGDLVVGDAYCVAPLSGGGGSSDSSDSPTTTAPSTPTQQPSTSSTLAPVMPNPAGFPVIPMPTPDAPGQYQHGVNVSCQKWHKVASGDGCWSISQEYNIELSSFYEWNPAVGSDCQSLWSDYYVCVGL